MRERRKTRENFKAVKNYEMSFTRVFKNTFKSALQKRFSAF